MLGHALRSLIFLLILLFFHFHQELFLPSFLEKIRQLFLFLRVHFMTSVYMATLSSVEGDT